MHSIAIAPQPLRVWYSYLTMQKIPSLILYTENSSNTSLVPRLIQKLFSNSSKWALLSHALRDKSKWKPPPAYMCKSPKTNISCNSSDVWYVHLIKNNFVKSIFRNLCLSIYAVPFFKPNGFRSSIECWYAPKHSRKFRLNRSSITHELLSTFNCFNLGGPINTFSPSTVNFFLSTLHWSSGDFKSP